jgi:hypothetical protein
MKIYRVTWEIDIDADSPEKAALYALHIQRDPESIATVFKVRAKRGTRTTIIDLNPEHS